MDPGMAEKRRAAGGEDGALTTGQSVFFDESLPRLVGVIRRRLGDAALREGVVLRDASGRLSFIAASPAPSPRERAHLVKAVTDALGAYARPDQAVAFADEMGARALLDDPARIPVQVDQEFCQLVDRRIVGSGWLDAPEARLAKPPRIVFASLKGGVGRTTALAVAATDLARRNRNVLVADLDLEAPGLGTLLFDEERTPRLGVLDFLVENGIGGIPDQFLDDFIAPSTLTTGEGGRVDVLPALGTASMRHPGNILPKLSRAMIDDIVPGGGSKGVSAQIAEMLDRLAARAQYDVVLIDSRAGLAELAAPAVLGLGANVLLFGTAQTQTIEAYNALFAALKHLAQRDRANGGKAEWRLMLKAVAAKARLGGGSVARYRDDLYDLFAENLYDAEDDGENVVTFLIDEEGAPHSPLVIPFNPEFADFDPRRKPEHLAQPFYEQTFRPFLDGLDALITADAEMSGAP